MEERMKANEWQRAVLLKMKRVGSVWESMVSVSVCVCVCVCECVGVCVSV